MAVAAQRPRLVELALGGYAAIVAVAAFSRTDLSHDNWLIGLAHVLVVLLVWLITRPGLGHAGRTLRDVAPLLILLGLYASLDVLNGSGTGPTYDHVLLDWEQRLFGMQPARDWWRLHPSAFWSTALHAVYLTYYPLVAVPALALMLRPTRGGIRRFLQAVIPTFLACYLFFVFLPVAGPYYVFEHPTGAFVANLPARLAYAVLSEGSSYGAAFPSSHVAATIAAWLSARRDAPRLARIMLPFVLLMPVATVYCQMHYALDAVFGVIFGLLVPSLARQLERADLDAA
ncbi:MAG: phosphatase PAP2 family protein [Gemmatimonadales bacterium]